MLESLSNSDERKSAYIEAGLTEIGINSSNGKRVIMIPQRSHGLSIGIVVILELARIGSVFSPAIKGSPAV